MTNDLVARGIRARDPQMVVGPTDPFEQPRLALTFNVEVGESTRSLTLFAYGSNVFAVTDGADFLYVDKDNPHIVRRATPRQVLEVERNRAYFPDLPGIGLPIDVDGEPIYNLVHREFDDLESILLPHVRDVSPVVTPDVDMTDFIGGAFMNEVEVPPVEVVDGRLRRANGELLSDYVRRLLT